MKFIKKDQLKSTLDETFSRDRGYWDLGNEFISYVEEDDENEIFISLHNKIDLRTLSPAERWIKDDKFAHEIQKKINNIKIDYGIDAFYMVCAKKEIYY